MSADAWKPITHAEVLSESKCPSCGTAGVYIGFITVECTNPSCFHYKPGALPMQKMNTQRSSLQVPFPYLFTSRFQYRGFDEWSHDVIVFVTNVAGVGCFSSIDSALNNLGWSSTVGLRKLFDNDYTEEEAANEILHWYDLIHGGSGYTAYTKKINGMREFKVNPKIGRDSTTWTSFSKSDVGRGPNNPKAPAKIRKVSP